LIFQVTSNKWLKYSDWIINVLARNRKTFISVIPAKAGIQEFHTVKNPWISTPRFHSFGGKLRWYDDFLPPETSCITQWTELKRLPFPAGEMTSEDKERPIRTGGE
jgi:hypothetical protein